MNEDIKRRELKDYQDYLWEELEDQFNAIREAYKRGEIILNDVTVEKSAVYLNTKNYISSVQCYDSTQKPYMSAIQKSRKENSLILIN